jgi:hypothetical protein
MSDANFAKTHLRDYIGSLLVPVIAEGFWSIHKNATEVCERTSQRDQTLRTFQNMLTIIPDWSQETLEKETERIQRATKCDYLEDLITGVMLSYLKSFATIHLKVDESDVEFVRPTLSEFVKQLYKESARKLWQTAYLFKVDNVSTENQARNRREIEKIIDENLEKVISSLLPWQTIAKKYFLDSSKPEVTPIQPQLEPEPEPEVKLEPQQKEKTRSVSFDDEEKVEDNEDYEDESELETDDDVKSIVISDEIVELDIDDNTKMEDDDIMSALESKITDSMSLST